MDITDRFIKYAQTYTTSCSKSEKHPSTERQMELARLLKKELKMMGLSEIRLDAYGYVYASLPGNTDKEVPKIGFVAHIDTSEDAPGENVRPQIVKDYDGNDILLANGEKIEVSKYPELKKYKGEDLITSDGKTLLGADDKAGVAEIMDALQYLTSHPEVKHGTIRVAFTPDEEIGQGADLFDIKGFDADWAYTMDGGEIGELEYENFNAASAKVIINGLNVHPGYGKGKMKNALLIATEYINALPVSETPEHTEGREGFYHLNGLTGTVERAELNYIIRDHDKELFENRKKLMEFVGKQINYRRGDNTVKVEMHDQYYNMKEKIEPAMHIVELAQKAMMEVGVAPKVSPIRGGTDGAMLSFKGLPCPNLFAGGCNFHSRYEYLPINSMKKASEVIVKIITLAVNEN